MAKRLPRLFRTAEPDRLKEDLERLSDALRAALPGVFLRRVFHVADPDELGSDLRILSDQVRSALPGVTVPRRFSADPLRLLADLERFSDLVGPHL